MSNKHQPIYPTANTEHAVEAAIAQAWQEQLAQVAQKPAFATMLLRQSRTLYDRFVAAYRHLLTLARPRRRKLLRRLGTSLAGAALALALSHTPIAHAANITVTTPVPDINTGDGHCSLFEAIINANDDASTQMDCLAGSGADTIKLSGNTYTVTTPYYVGFGLPPISSTITIAGNGATLARASNATDSFTVLAIVPNGDLTLNQTTITGGEFFLGGGIYNYRGALALNNSTVSDNTASGYAGGILNLSGEVTLINSTVTSNTTMYGGGGIVNVDSTVVQQASQRPGPRAGHTSKRLDSAQAGRVGSRLTDHLAHPQRFARRQARTTAVNYGTLTLINSVVTGNSVMSNGGGIFNLRGEVSLTNSTVSTNTTTVCCGGGIYTNLGSVTLDNSTVVGNFAAHNGGGIDSVYSDLTLQNNSRLDKNRAGNDGGGINSYYSTITLTNSTISGNKASSDGGGIDVYGGTVSLINSTVSGNAAVKNGGGLDPDYTTVTLKNSTLSGNTAGGFGGAINVADESSLTLTNSTVTRNMASKLAGGLYITQSTAVTLERTIIAGNMATIGITEIFKEITSTVSANRVNLFGESSQTNVGAFSQFTPGASDLTATMNGTKPTALAGILNATLANNGGATKTHALAVGSPAIDAAPIGPATDQRGVARPQGIAFDIGAFETKVINSSVKQTSVVAGAYNPTLVPCGGTNKWATQTVTPVLHNNTATTFTGLFFKVKTLAYKAAQAGNVQPKLCNANPSGGGVGAILAVGSSLAGNGDLSQAFQIGLPARAAYSFFVDLYSISAVETQAANSDEGEYLGSFAYEFDADGQLVGQHPLFLPLVVR